MLDELFLKSDKFVQLNNLVYKRYFIREHQFEHRMSIILGARGIGKTTTIAQYMHDNYKDGETTRIQNRSCCK